MQGQLFPYLFDLFLHLLAVESPVIIYYCILLPRPV